MFSLLFLFVNLLYLEKIGSISCSRPNIIVIVADDLGWNDVGFHGSNEIPTPNIDALAYTGLILNNYYVNPICTPSRSALMTGFHPIHTGLQSGVLVGAAPYALPLKFKLLPEYLQHLNYSNHIVGKWHLGSHRDIYTPTKRGFESHIGFWTGHMDYYDHTAQELYPPVFSSCFLQGMQHGVITGTSPYGLPLNFKILPEFLKTSFNYSTHLVGKWHLGHLRNGYFPTSRGFETHVGYLLGKADYFDHTNYEKQGWGYDFRRNLSVAWSDYGKYSTDIFTEAAEDLIRNHARNPDPNPLFLYMAHQAVHSANTYSPVQAPYSYVNKFRTKIKDPNRRKFAGVLTKLDESVGKLVKVLQENHMLHNSVIVFTTDNGGPASGFDVNYASNWPLKGVKDTLWEGGVRGSAFIWSPLLKSSSRIAKQMMNVQDWLPTLYSAAGGNHGDLPQMDGLDMWTALSENKPSPRNLMLHNIDDKRLIAAVRVGDWKLVKGTTYNGNWDGYYGPSGRDPRLKYDFQQIYNCDVSQALQAIGIEIPNRDKIERLREESDINCENTPTKNPCEPLQQICLFNITADPCEQNNLVLSMPDVVRMMKQTLKMYRATAMPPGNKPIDPRGDPKFYDYTWTNWMDIVEPVNPHDNHKGFEVSSLTLERELEDLLKTMAGLGHFSYPGKPKIEE